jgi:Flp pilus assembly pilin Flp
MGRFWFICFYSLLSTLPDTPYLNINKARGSPKENSMVEFIKRFVKEDDGLEMVEWAVVGSTIVVVAALAFIPLGEAVTAAMGTIAGYVQ